MEDLIVGEDLGDGLGEVGDGGGECGGQGFVHGHAAAARLVVLEEENNRSFESSEHERIGDEEDTWKKTVRITHILYNT